MNQLVSTDDLMAWSDIKQRNKLIQWLRDNGIPFRLNRTGFPITTVAAINNSLAKDDDQAIEFPE